MEPERLSKSILPSLMAFAISAAPLLPNNAVAFCSASVSLEAFLMSFTLSLSASLSDLPSLAAFFTAVFIAISAVLSFTPFFSNCAIKEIDSSSESPISLNVALLSRTLSIRLLTETPVSCPLAVIIPSRSGRFSAEMFHACIMRDDLETLSDTSVSLILANCKYCSDTLRSCSSV